MSSQKPLRPGAVLATISGNALEWYDFTMYAFLAPTIASLFFPADDKLASLLSAFAVLALGYAARPIGSLIFGHVGDRIGRKTSLMITVLITGGGSLAIGLLPTYDQIGIAAAIALVAIRLVQGIAVAGEFSASGVLLIEQTAPEHRNRMSTWVQFAMFAGSMAGSAVPALVSNILTEDQLSAWGWRIPFLIGAVVAFLSFIFRSGLRESLHQGGEDSPEAPALEILRKHKLLILRMLVLQMPLCIIYFVIFVYGASYMTESGHFQTAQALNITTANLAILALAMPLFGLFADRVGLRNMYLGGAFAVLIVSVPAWALMHRPELQIVFVGQLLLTLSNVSGQSMAVAAMSQMAPSRIRCSAMGLGYNLSVAIFGGTTPLLATYVVHRTSNDYWPIYYLMITTVISLWVIMKLPGPFKRPEQS